MVLTALLLVVLLGMVALVIDVGFAAGQRRFMQNGADAAALAAAHLLAESISPYPTGGGPSGIPQYFDVNQGAVAAVAMQIAKANQNPGVLGRTSDFYVTVEYCVAANDNSYAPQTPGCPSPNSWVTGSSDPSSAATVPDGTYKVRVTTHSTLATVFGRVIGQSTTNSVAQGIAVILGVCPQLTVTGNIWPFTLWDGLDFGTPPGTLYELWGPNAPNPFPNGAWKSVLDFTPAPLWCNGSTSATNPDYAWKYPAMIPNEDQGAPVNCSDPTAPTDPTKNFTGTDPTWYRDGYSQDSRGGCFVGNDLIKQDPATWAATTYQGTVRVHDFVSGATGNKVPTFHNEQPANNGDVGQNIAAGIWGGSTLPCVGTNYFFQQISGTDQFGPYRSVVVLTWDHAEFWDSHTNTWSTSGNAPDRVELMRVLHFRIYPNYGSSNPNNASIYGRVVSPDFPPGYPPADCPNFGKMGPGIYGNVVRLGA